MPLHGLSERLRALFVAPAFPSHGAPIHPLRTSPASKNTTDSAPNSSAHSHADMSKGRYRSLRQRIQRHHQQHTWRKGDVRHVGRKRHSGCVPGTAISTYRRSLYTSPQSRSLAEDALLSLHFPGRQPFRANYEDRFLAHISLRTGSRMPIESVFFIGATPTV